MKIIKLSQNKECLVDDMDYEKLSLFKWSFDRYPIRRDCSDKPRGKIIYMHREILNPPLGMVCDHIDGNPLNNQRSNLRICTQAQNMMNTKMRKHNKLGVKGVRWYKPSKSFHARIGYKGKSIHLGYFKNINDAYEAYCNAALRLHGDFARL